MIEPVLCWDIDGTLLSTARGGVFALEKAALEVTGRPLDLQAMPTAGLTDVEITHLILQRHGAEVSGDNERRFLQIYEDDLPASLHRRQGQVMPGVRSILEALRARPSWGSILLTGNTRRGARAKLEHYGLDAFFSDGAFSDGTRNRPQIAERALALIGEKWPGRPADHIVVIGDTPHDITCARAIGARCVAVATGGYAVSALQDLGADTVLEVLPEPAVFFSLVTELCSRRAT